MKTLAAILLSLLGLASCDVGGAAFAQPCSGIPNANTICAGVPSGLPGFPGFRPMVGADVDSVGGTTRGSIMERGASGWTGVAPGTLGLPWVSNGAGADPGYQPGFHWGPTSIGMPILASGEIYYDNTGTFAEHNSTFNIFVDWGASAPSAVLPSTFVGNQCQGNNSTFVGCAGIFIKTIDRPGVNSANKGVLYGLDIDIGPSVTRNNSPADDATGFLVNNVGTGTGTEAIFLGHSGSVTTDWNGAIGIQASAFNAIYAVGTYTYGVTFAHGGNATFSNGGGVLLVPPPGVTTPIVSVGSDAFTPSNNKNAISVDANAQVIFTGQGAWFQFGNNPRYVYTESNVGAVFPATLQGLAVGGNFTNASGEDDFFNTNTAATDSFRFYQQTGASAATLVLDLTITNATFAGSVTAGTDLFSNDASFLVRANTALTNGGGGGTSPTLGTNGPTGATTPTKWIQIDDNGTTRRIPAW